MLILRALRSALLAPALMFPSFLSVSACSRAEAPKAAPSSATALPLAPPAASSVAPAELKPAPIALQLRVEPSQAQVSKPALASLQRVLLTSPELGVDELIAEIAFPNTCRAFAAEGERPWRVTCTPRYRKPVAEAFGREHEVVLRLLPQRGEARELHLPLAAGRTFEPLAAEVSSRSTPCDPALVAKRMLRVTLPSANWGGGYTPASIFSLAVPGNPILQLTDEHGWWTGCKAKERENAIDIQCPKDSHVGKIAVDGPSIRFEWQDKQRDAGRVLIPCDAQAVLVRPDSFSSGIMYR